MKFSRIYIFLFIVIFALNVDAQAVTSLFVSPQGNDSGDGSADKPYQTIEKAQSKVRSLVRNIDEDIHVYLRGGDYQLEAPLVFTTKDGGTNGHQVIYSAYKNEKPVLNGGIKLQGWQEEKDGTWVVDFDGDYFRQLYVNNDRRTRARQPNAGQYFKVREYDFKHKDILVDRNDVQDWTDIQNVEMVLQIHWSEAILRLQSVSAHGPYNAKSAHVVIHPDDAAILFNRPHPSHRVGQAYHLENSIEFLDEPGEWFYDRDNHKIYYKPLSGESIANTEIVVPVLKNLLIIEGKADAPVTGLAFEGLHFMYANWQRPGNKRYINIQAGMFNCYTDANNLNKVLRPKAAVHVTWAQNIRFENSLFKNLGSTGLDLNYGTRDCTIKGNVFCDISGGGIMVGKFVKDSLTSINEAYNPPDKREICTGDIVSNNYITRTGQDYYGTCAIAAGYPANIQITHNTIVNIPYTGISLGYGWTDENNAMKNNIIANNEIKRAMTILSDGGGIYTLSKQPGTRIEGNYVHDLKKATWASPWPMAGIYLDQASGGTMVEPFVVERNLVDIDFNTGNPYNFNRPRIVLLVNNYKQNRGNDECIDIIENAGLQKEYKHLIHEKK